MPERPARTSSTERTSRSTSESDSITIRPSRRSRPPPSTSARTNPTVISPPPNPNTVIRIAAPSKPLSSALGTCEAKRENSPVAISRPRTTGHTARPTPRPIAAPVDASNFPFITSANSKLWPRPITM